MATTAMPLCYHGGISKTECEEMLCREGKDGAYLIRESETVKGALCLCVYKQGVVYTYRLYTSGGFYSIQTEEGVNKTFFATLWELILHFKQKNQGLAMHLRYCVNRKNMLQIQPQPLRSEGADDADYENVYPIYVTVLPS